MPVSAVIFDFFGTLTPSTPPDHVWHEHAARSAAPLGIAATAWFKVLEDSLAERFCGALGDLSATFAELARRAGAAPSPEALSAACAARVASQREMFALRPDALAVLAQVRALGLPVGVLSDCTIELAQAWTELPVAGLVDARVLSCEAGRRKPDPVLFAMIAGQLGTAPAQCLYIGDGGGRELTGASRAGMRPVLLRAPDWDAQVTDSRDHDWAGLAVGSLTEVLGLLG